MTTATLQATGFPFCKQAVQICNVEQHQRFTFVDAYNGSPDTEYVKIGNTHYRKAGMPQAVCIPIRVLSGAIRTLVVLS